MNRYLKLIAIALITCCLIVASNPIQATAKSPDWIVRSNASADLLSKAIAAKDCEEKITVPYTLREIDPAFTGCRQENILNTVETLEQKLAQAKNPQLRFDLKILLKSGRQIVRSQELDDKYRLPYADLSQAIMKSLRNTLKESNKPSEQRQIILTKLKQYAGLEPNTIALTTSIERAIEAQLQQPELALPSSEQLTEDLSNNASQISAIQAFLRQQEVSGDREAYDELKAQLFDYETFIRRQVLTRVKNNFRLPRELYAFELEQQGIEMPIEALIDRAHAVFTEVQSQMDEMAIEIAQQKEIGVSGYRDLIQMLKQERLSAKDTLSLYKERSQDLESKIKQHDLLTFQDSKFNIRLVTAEEKKNFPVPLYEPFSSTFVIPVFQDKQKATAYNDFTNPAMSWTLTVHELRPGHDLQHAIIDKQNLSRARTDFAASATSIEGWATYAEEMMRPYLPLEGQFMCLQFQLLRAARAFLEPELQLGKITANDALKVLTVDAGFSQFFAEQEIERYTSIFPGQAPAYFYGSQQLLKLRSQAQKILGEDFTMKKFHDFVLSQGFLSPKLLEQVLLDKID